MVPGLMSRRPFVVCLTGGVASGKTAVSDYWKQQGLSVVDTDVLAREVVEPNTVGLELIIKAYGSDILEQDGRLNRKKLRAIVFDDENQRKRLNSIVHPLIRAEVLKQIRRVDCKLVVIVVPLYRPDIDYDFIDRVCLVDCIESVQVERLIRRDDVSISLARKMLAAQPLRQERLNWANDVVVNNQSFYELKKSALNLVRLYKAISDSIPLFIKKVTI